MNDGKHNARQFLRKRLYEKQIRILAFCLVHDIPVGLYGDGLGKSTLVARLKKACYTKVYAPEDCSQACGPLTVPNIPGAVALCVRKKSPGKDIPEDFFTNADLCAVINKSAIREEDSNGQTREIRKSD